MRKTLIKELGTIKVEELEVLAGQMEIYIPIQAVGEGLEKALNKCEVSYKKEHPEVENIGFNINLVFTFGFANPEFELQILVFNADNQETYEEYDGSFVGDIELSEEQSKQIKKVVWDKLGEKLLNL